MPRRQPIVLAALAAVLVLPGTALGASSAPVATELVAAPPGARHAPSARAPSLSPTPTPLASRESVTSAPPLPRLTDVARVARSTAAVPTPLATELPETGADTWLTLLAGIGLLMTGTGLRLRTAAPAR